MGYLFIPYTNHGLKIPVEVRKADLNPLMALPESKVNSINFKQNKQDIV
jgi:hypothetical protein